MLIYGLDYLNNQFKLSFSFTQILNEGINCLEFSTDLLARTNIKKAVFCKNINEVLLCNAALCEFIIPSKAILDESVRLAQNYLFDSKILMLITNENHLSLAANHNVDAVLVCKMDDKYKNYFLA